MNDRLKSIASFFGGDDEPEINENWREEEVSTWNFATWNDRIYVNTSDDDRNEKLYFCKADDGTVKLIRKELGKVYHSTIKRDVNFCDETDDWGEAFEKVYNLNFKNVKFEEFFSMIQNKDLKKIN